MRQKALCFVFIVGFLLLAGGANAERRVALVIGNSSYQSVSVLPNPKNDAAAMADLFRRAKFDDVIVRIDTDNVGFRQALREFTEKSADADISVVFYAGHGIEIKDQNYLVPVDAKLASDIDAQDEAVTLDRVMQSMRAKKLKLVFLDACRDNPFAAKMRRVVSTRAISRGLASVELDADDTLIAYAAKAGTVARDGEGNGSPFTLALVNHLLTPGLDIRIALGRVRDDVVRGTSNPGPVQQPFVYGTLGGDMISLARDNSGSGRASEPRKIHVEKVPSASPLPQQQASLPQQTPEFQKASPQQAIKSYNSYEYQLAFDTELRSRRYPRQISAICEGGRPMFSASFSAYPSGPFAFYSHHGVGEAVFESKDRAYRSMGFRMVWHDRLICGGAVYHQATWVRQ